MAQFLGRAKIQANGTVIDSAPGATLDLGGIANKPVVFGSRVGRVEEFKNSTITLETGVEAGRSLDELQNLKDATVIFECDTGQQYIVRNAFRGETLNMKDGDGGNLAVQIYGDPAEELMA